MINILQQNQYMKARNHHQDNYQLKQKKLIQEKYIKYFRELKSVRVESLMSKDFVNSQFGYFRTSLIFLGSFISLYYNQP
jgi:hypothetical protein